MYLVYMGKKHLEELYILKKMSVSKIAEFFKCSENKVNYWLNKYGIPKRSISDAIYHLKNPNGDPFEFRVPKKMDEAFLYGLGMGLYWGEGLKRGAGGLRLGNTDAKLIKKFIEFLERIYSVDKQRLRFGLQIFNDIDPNDAISFWSKKLGVSKSQFYKVMISKIRGEGTYKYKSQYGVLVVYFNNSRLKKIICDSIENM